jgi:hypothetical protein
MAEIPMAVTAVTPMVATLVAKYPHTTKIQINPNKRDFFFFEHITLLCRFYEHIRYDFLLHNVP